MNESKTICPLLVLLLALNALNMKLYLLVVVRETDHFSYQKKTKLAEIRCRLVLPFPRKEWESDCGWLLP